MTEDVDLGLKIPENLHALISDFIVVVIKVVTMVEVDIGLKIPAPLPITIVEQ